MLKKKSLIIGAGSFVLLLSALLIYSGNPSLRENFDSKNTIDNPISSQVKSIDVDYVVENPEEYVGLISVEGTVTEIASDNKYFTLGCEDACVNLPVSYKGEFPKLDSNIIASGEVKKDNDGKYFFDAREFKYK